MIETFQLGMTYNQGTCALKEVSLGISEKEFTVILGKSGAGKSTLIRTFNGLIQPSAGSVKIEGRPVNKMTHQEIRELRRHMGMIFQQFHLIPQKTVLQNVLAGRLAYSSPFWSLLGFFSEEDHELAEEALKSVGLYEKKTSLAKNLSGGQMQRVAIARALVQKPKFIIGDEPVASLDPVTSKEILELLKKIHMENKVGIILNMHDVTLALAYAERIIGLNQGEVVFDGKKNKVDEKVLQTIYA